MDGITIAFVAYLVGFAFVAGFFFNDHIRFRDKEYTLVAAIALTWPLGMAVIIFQKMTGVYVGEIWKDAKKWYKQFECNHNNTESCEGYTLQSGKKGDRICTSCGKVWWE